MSDSIPAAKIVVSPEPAPDPGAPISLPADKTIVGTISDQATTNATTQQAIQAAGSPPNPVVKTIMNATITYSYDLGTQTFGAKVVDNKTGEVYAILYDANLDFVTTEKELLNELSVSLSTQTSLKDTTNVNTIKACISDVVANFLVDTVPFKIYLGQIAQTTSANTAANLKMTLGELSKALDITLGSANNPLNLALQFQTPNQIVSTVAHMIGGQLGSEVASAISLGAKLLGGNNPAANTAPQRFKFADYIDSLVVNAVPVSVTTHPKQNESKSVDTEGSTKAFIETPTTRTNPTDPTKTALAQPDNRVTNNLGIEPTKPFNALYPYNKTQQTEGGHILEIDDTPDNKRILTQHVSGTYDEMHDDGSKVTKVVTDNYLIVANDNFVSIHGKTILHIDGDVNLRIGGHLNIIADDGINVTTKGDYRVIAKSINMETVGGDVSIKSSADTLISSTGKASIVSDTTHIDSTQDTSMTVGANYSVAADNINQTAKTAYNSLSGDKTSISGGSIDLAATGNIAIDGATTLVQAGQAVTATPDAPVPGDKSKGSGIAYSSNPAMAIEENDDDPEALAAALKHGLDTGAINRDELNAPPGDASASDASGASKTGNGTTKSTVGNLGGTTPPDNMRLTPHFTVGQLSKYTPAGSHIVKAQNGLSITDIVSNMQLLAVNCLEPILAKYPEMKPTSGFRTRNNGKSQHEKGMACDIQFASANRDPALYYEYAKWIKDNIVFDQLLLEYKSTGTKLPWIHISFNPQGNRHQVLTLYNGATHSSGLTKLK